MVGTGESPVAPRLLGHCCRRARSRPAFLGIACRQFGRTVGHEWGTLEGRLSVTQRLSGLSDGVIEQDVSG